MGGYRSPPPDLPPADVPRPDDLPQVSLLEKAFAKLHGSFGALEGGWVHDALADLTGGASYTIDLHADGLRLGLWERLLAYHVAGLLLGAGSPAGSDSEVTASGIALGHAYAVLEVREVDGWRLVLLR